MAALERAYRTYRGTSLIRNSPPPPDHHRALGIVLLYGPRWVRSFISDVPLYAGTLKILKNLKDLHWRAGSSKSLVAIRKKAGIFCGSFVRKGEALAYMGETKT